MDHLVWILEASFRTLLWWKMTRFKPLTSGCSQADMFGWVKNNVGFALIVESCCFTPFYLEQVSFVWKVFCYAYIPEE